MLLRRHAASLAAAVLVSAIAPRLYAQARIAVVDLQRAILECDDGRRAKVRLERLFDRRQREIKRRQDELQSLRDDIEKNREIWTRDTLGQRVEEYQRAMVELQQTYEQYQREIAQKEADLTRPIAEKMTGILERIGRTQGHSVIIDRSRSGVVWAQPALDLTDELLRRYAEEEGAEEEGAEEEAPARAP